MHFLPFTNLHLQVQIINKLLCILCTGSLVRHFNTTVHQKEKQVLYVPVFLFDNPYGLRTHLQNILVLDWGRIVCPVVPCRNHARQGIFPYKFLIALLSKNLLVRTRLIERLGSQQMLRKEHSRLLLLSKSTGHTNFLQASALQSKIN